MCVKRSGAVSVGVFRGGLRTPQPKVGTGHMAKTTATDRIYCAFERNRDLTECIHEPVRHGGVLVFIEARE